MDAINKALEEVENQIPPQILRYAFVGRDSAYNRIPVNIQSLIRDLVIGHRVIKDCNINGGVRDFIKLTGLPFRMTEHGHRIYHVPKSITQGRSIINPLSVGNSHYVDVAMNLNNTSTGGITSLAGKVLDANTLAIPFHTTDVRCVGENIILVEDIWNDLGPDAYLLAVFGNDEMMSNLPPRSWSLFEDLVVLATKAWIYNNCNISIDSGVIEMGMEIGRFREIVDNYSDANQMYRELLDDRWQKHSILSDKTSKKRVIRRIVPTR